MEPAAKRAADRTHVSGAHAAAVCLALFVFAGYFKAAAPLRAVPVDLTLIFWALTAGFCLIALWRERRLPPNTLPMLLMFATLAVGLHWPQDFASYPAQKELRLFSLTALAGFAPLLLLRGAGERKAFLWTVGLLGAAMAVSAVVEIGRVGDFNRITAFGTNPILLGRATGFSALLLCLLYWQGHIRFWLFAAAIAVVGVALVASGSRGPLAALLVTAALLGTLCAMRRESRWRLFITAAVGCIALVSLVLWMDSARIHAGHRVMQLAAGDWGGTDVSRWLIWRRTVALIAETPLGVGWGRLSEHVTVLHDGNLLTHPHNILLECAAEAGWPAALVLALVTGGTLLFALRRAYQAQAGAPQATGLTSTRSLAVAAALAYWLFCAAFSGDVNDNRTFWAMLGMALAAVGAGWRGEGQDARHDGRRFGRAGEPAAA